MIEVVEVRFEYDHPDGLRLCMAEVERQAKVSSNGGGAGAIGGSQYAWDRGYAHRTELVERLEQLMAAYYRAPGTYGQQLIEETIMEALTAAFAPPESLSVPASTEGQPGA